MNKNHWKIRLLIWAAKHIVRVPIIVNFTPEWMTNIYAVGFAWTPQAANRMKGDPMLIERARQASLAAQMAQGTRTARRMVNRAARRAAKKELKNGR